FIKRTILVAALLSFGLTSIEVKAAATPYKDIQDSFAYSSILSLHEKGLISVISEDIFAPNEAMKRNHFVMLLGKTLGVQPIHPIEPTFVDVSTDDAEYGYIEAFAKLGYISGFEGNVFK